jgi:cell division protein FtsZ
MSITLQLPKLTDLRPRITVIGVGGAGGNAINNMIASGLTGVEYIAANTDAQALAASSAERRIQLGANLTEGLGAGSKPEIGEAAAEEALDEIRGQLAGSHMVFIAAGMGGGTGTGAASVIARAAREVGALTVGIVTKPFQFEGARRMRVAEAGIAELRKYVDTLIVIPNQNLFRIATERTTFAEAFILADQVLYSGVACVVDLIVKEGLINLDFADVRTVMCGMGTAMMGTGEASGERRAIRAAEEAIANPLIDEVSLKGAKGLLVSIIGGRDMTLYEVDEAASRVRQEVDPEANIIVGATFEESLGDRIRVAIVASGMTPQAAASQQGSRPREAAGSAPPHGGASSAGPAAPAANMPQMSATDSAERQAGSMEPTGPLHRAPEVWRAPGDVLIEEDLSPFVSNGPARTQPPPLSQTAAERPFSPQPPQELHGGGRRLPELQDFPPIAQREYHAKAGQYPAPAMPSRPAPQTPHEARFSESSSPAPSGRRGGFLQRLKERRLREV